MLIEDDEIVEDPIIGVAVDRVASSWVDMLAGLSPWGILSTPPDFCASTASGADMAMNNAPTAARVRTYRFIASSLLWCRGAQSLRSPIQIGGLGRSLAA